MQAASQAQIDQMMGAYAAYTQEMINAGAMAGGDRLQRSSSATTVRVKNGKT
jgi:hypothetical protein